MEINKIYDDITATNSISIKQKYGSDKQLGMK